MIDGFHLAWLALSAIGRFPEASVFALDGIFRQ
jgi:hypothetical protein